ncbi:hypothetical protein BDM02DRAFT_3132573 [Thelephora ganbajun]|uniref:Uncharacterized protein n=1 Tax=Thelephora ganbajun TaxID=370292 RepID=A0ACB6Z0I5_THEGA|nr:hypothetical protein BDM02DRAFT_3132573 [Thelephora ganbajun]
MGCVFQPLSRVSKKPRGKTRLSENVASAGEILNSLVRVSGGPPASVTNAHGRYYHAFERSSRRSKRDVTAFIKLTIRAQDETNCVMEDALKTARELDAHFAATKGFKGPLHSVPISSLIERLVRQVREAGDTTKNPHDAKYIPGGSSEGEGALLAMGGDPILEAALGFWRISVDCTISSRALAGSAHQEHWHKRHGVFTPSADPNPGFKNVPTALGPMIRTVVYIEIASRVVFGKSANYPSAPVPHRQVKLERKLKFVHHFDDGMAQITPACYCAVCDTVEALRKQGHECVEFEFPSHLFRNKDPDPTGPNLELAYTYIPRFLHAMIGRYLEKVDPVLARVWIVSIEKDTRIYQLGGQERCLDS